VIRANRRPTQRYAFSLIEVIVTMTILGVLLSFTAPSVLRTVEQSHADLAGAGLRMIHSAQRFYWLENRVYAGNLQLLIDDDLVDEQLNAGMTRYDFAITNADADGFAAVARRRLLDGIGNPIYNGAWQGTFTIDESGEITGTVDGPTSIISGNTPQLTPAF
jgi:prepilin-type N-terminal cleavage/methylation domain-containing protein